MIIICLLSSRGKKYYRPFVDLLLVTIFMHLREALHTISMQWGKTWKNARMSLNSPKTKLYTVPELKSKHVRFKINHLQRSLAPELSISNVQFSNWNHDILILQIYGWLEYPERQILHVSICIWKKKDMDWARYVLGNSILIHLVSIQIQGPSREVSVNL